ncbi:TetR family transcriptional regulator [Nocardia sp. NPDC052001]|uniref:TetR/AcrR family transcriptional regulator n=1 Tax=Nocardia sp. NPDC052001 TaxID=3154853 RepID=UPI00342A4B1D
MASGSAARTQGEPLRGTRPANRRELIVRAAAELFHRNGYAKVAMGEVAEAVAIGPSALYRHFRGKQDLLDAVVGDALHTVEDALRSATVENLAATMAKVALERREIGILIRRESRQLSVPRRRVHRELLDRIGSGVAELIRTRRPELGVEESELLAWSALAVVSSVSHHRLSLPDPESPTLLTELVTAVIDTPITLPAAHRARAGRRPALTMYSRREALLAEAVRLFARDGFAGVSMEDIGAGIGIAGPSVYNHFAVKSELLSAAMFRGGEWLRMEMARAFADAADARDGLRRVLTGYRAFVFGNPDLIEVLVSESMHLPESDRHRARATQHDYIAEWVHLAVRIHPAWDPVSARIRVQAVQTMINDISLLPHLSARPGVDDALVTIGARLLMISE